MRLLLCVLLMLSLLLPVCSLADDRPTIFVATDPHFISPELTDYGPFFMRMIENGDGVKPFDLADGYCNINYAKDIQTAEKMLQK